MSGSRLTARCASMGATALFVGSLIVGASPLAAHATATLDIVGPAGSGAFGPDVTVLSNRNFVVVDSLFDASPTQVDVGAVYLYNGATNALISRLIGSTSGDSLGDGGVTEVGTTDFVVRSTSWDNVAAIDAGAVTWVDGTSGLNGLVSAANSLVGTAADDSVGDGGITLLSNNGNYVVRSTGWDNGAVADAGAVTWGSGTAGVKGEVSPANSLVGTTAFDSVGNGGVTALAINGNYVVGSPAWHRGAVSDAGAVTWANGTTGFSGAVSAANSLVGTTDFDGVGSDFLGLSGITPLTDGDYVVVSAAFDNGAVVDAGAATWGSGTAGIIGAVTAANSLVGAGDNDRVGTDFAGIAAVTPLTNGNYVVTSAAWDDGGADDAGAVTWGDGDGGASGEVAPGNSLVGGRLDDRVGTNSDGINAVTAMPDGDYVVTSTLWGDGSGGTGADVGAVTLGNGLGGTVDEVTDVNSLVGTSDGDQIGSGGVTAMAIGGNYVVASPLWDNQGTVDAGAVTWGDGADGTTGEVSAANSLVGTNTGDSVGGNGVTALTNGNYVVSSTDWDNVAGAATWGNGTTGTVGAVSAGNSLVGTTADDAVGNAGVTALTNGNYVVASPVWNDGLVVDAGAATWGNGAGGTVGAVSDTNSLVGSIALDNVGNDGVISLTNGNYVVDSPLWDNGVVVDAGAVTWSSGVAGPFGVVSAANSLVGTSALDGVGGDGVTQLTNGNYVVTSAHWNNGAVSDAGAVTWGNGAGGTVGAVSASNSLAGSSANDFVGTDETASNGVTALAGGDYAVVSASWNNGAVVDSGAATYGPAGGISGSITPTNSSIGTPLGSIQSISERLTTDDSLVVSTGQNRVLLLRVGAQSPVFPATPSNVTVSTAAGAADAPASFTTPAATAKVGTPTVVCTPASGAVFPVGVTTVTCTATDSAKFTASTSFTVTVNATPAKPTPDPTPGPTPGPGPTTPVTPDQVPLTPARLADTRPGQSTTDSLFAGGGIRESGSTLELTVAGRGGVADNAAAVALNVTAVDPTVAGFVTVYPCGSPQPTASSLNFVAGAVVPNAVIARIGSDGKVCLFVSASTHLVVDVASYFASTTSLHAMNPARVLDTREGQPTADGSQQGEGIRDTASITHVQITGRESIPADASAVVLNVTVTEAQAPGFATVFPCGTDVPTASNINYGVGSTVANLVIAKIGVGGTVCIFTQSAAHLIADVNGYFPAATSYKPLVPARILETRTDGTTIDGRFVGAGLRPAESVTTVSVVDRGGVPAGAATVVLNVTVTEPTAAGFVTVYPCDVDRPLASNLNFDVGTTVANAVIVKVGATGEVCLFNSNPAQLIVDVNGYMST
jgi:trimeric autotransporter adhesin